MKPIITFEDFAKLDLRVGEITKCEKKEGSEKLLRMTVDFGTEGKRNILAGLAAWYEPDALVDKQFIFIINLAPRKMMGEESQGMLLAADPGLTGTDHQKPEPLLATNYAPNGAIIK